MTIKWQNEKENMLNVLRTHFHFSDPLSAFQSPADWDLSRPNSLGVLVHLGSHEALLTSELLYYVLN